MVVGVVAVIVVVAVLAVVAVVEKLFFYYLEGKSSYPCQPPPPSHPPGKDKR